MIRRDGYFTVAGHMSVISVVCSSVTVSCTYLQAQRMAENALNVFEKLEQVRPTKSSIFGFIVGQLLAKSASVEAELALTSQDRDEKLLAACEVCTCCI